jgi:ribose transport system permease protein
MDEHPNRPAKAGRYAREIPGVGWVLALLVVVFSIFGSGFATASNAINIGVQSSVLLLLSLPMTFIIMSEGLDLSMGAVLSLCGVILALLLAHERPLPIALAAALGVGLMFGVTNGLLVAGLELPPFVATLGTLGIAQGVALVMTDGQSVVGIGERLPALYKSTLGGLQV